MGVYQFQASKTRSCRTPGQCKRTIGLLLLLLVAMLAACGCRQPMVDGERGGPSRGLGRLASASIPSSDTPAPKVESSETASNFPWLQTPKPSHNRHWRPDLAVLPFAEIGSEEVKLYNIRDCEYRTEEDYDVRLFDRPIRLSDVLTVDFIVVPFKETPALAHTMLSFGLADGQQLVFSVEARLEQGESYAAIPSAAKQFELMWVVGTERDLIRLRTEVRDVDVYLYPIKATPAQAQKVFLAALARVNGIARTPEFYDLLTNNCTTNIVDLVNSLRPGTIGRDLRVVLPGHSDRLAYDLGLLAGQGPFETVKIASKINGLAKIHAKSKDFSRAIRYWRQ